MLVSELYVKLPGHLSPPLFCPSRPELVEGLLFALNSARGGSIYFLGAIRGLRIDLEMIDPFKISLDIRDRGWVSEAEPHPP
jgi:hypothetical protein